MLYVLQPANTGEHPPEGHPPERRHASPRGVRAACIVERLSPQSSSCLSAPPPTKTSRKYLRQERLSPPFSSQNQLPDPATDKDENSGGFRFRGSATGGSGGILRSAASLTSEALMGRGGVGFNPARDCDAVIRDVRRRTARERVRITDLFQDFDRHQHGTQCRRGEEGVGLVASES